MKVQKMLSVGNGYKELDDYLSEHQIRKIFLVCGKSALQTSIGKYFLNLKEKRDIEVFLYMGFTPNPTYEEAVEGVRVFLEQKCNLICAVGGGSAIDVAKCIKLFSNMSPDKCYLDQLVVRNDRRLLAVPTTAGTGSEATKYAVIYYKGEKQSITDESCIPDAVILDKDALTTLPDYHRKASMLDALCHAVESFWSINSTEESREYSRRALQMILENKEDYLANREIGNENMLTAAYLAGKAINIAQTTVGHAMSYKLTGIYGIAHGHAVALCLYVIWPYMAENLDACIDIRGRDFLEHTLESIADAMDCGSIEESIQKFQSIVKAMNLLQPRSRGEKEYELLLDSVNPVRLKNNPIYLKKKTINMLYHQILSHEDGKGNYAG